MSKENKLIQYWAGMLNEAMEGKGETDELNSGEYHGYIDAGYFRYVYPVKGANCITMADLAVGIQNMFPGQAYVNFGPSGKIFGRINGIRENDGKTIFTIAPYKNGLHRCDYSTNPDAPEMGTAALLRAIAELDQQAEIIVEFKDPNGFGASKKTIWTPIKNIEISKTDGLYLRPDFEKQEIVSVTKDPAIDFMMRRAGKLDEVRHSMRGPAAARRDGGIDEIADMRQKLANGVVEFTFWKHGEEGQGDVQRHAVGTTSENVVPVAERRRLDPNYDENVASYERRANFIIWFWDLEKNAVRCFNTNRFDEILNYEPTDRRAAPNVERVGNIFIHRDVDDGANRPLDDARIDEINGRLDDMMQNDDDELVQALRGTADGFGVRGMYVDRTADGVPTLRIEISKRGTDQDPPYQLRINELRSLIRDRFGVDVKTVTVDGTFRY